MQNRVRVAVHDATADLVWAVMPCARTHKHIVILDGFAQPWPYPVGTKGTGHAPCGPPSQRLQGVSDAPAATDGFIRAVQLGKRLRAWCMRGMDRVIIWASWAVAS